MSPAPFELLRLDTSHVALLRPLNLLFGDAFADPDFATPGKGAGAT